ncbi:DUF3060 domain-containing protein [Actinomyces howellii]|uniref:DUF3060 domain-containing protein n=1 Tax=Actinomyces howellii TaxID=52771 RepID=A0A3S4RGF3_9ACTO|nr:DUF3060 domain-containing protein [Actinomyces howellii]VEG29200.1 Uncharacterised protein [Actinomyces howellii]
MRTTRHSTRATRSLSALACGGLALALSACSISIGSPASEPSPSTQDQAVASPAGADAAATTAPSGARTTGTLASQGSTASAGGREASEEASAQDRPGAHVTITDADWLEAEQAVDQTMSAGDGTVVVSEDNADVRIEGDVTTLTITGANVWLVADYVENLVIEGGNASVYVRDLGTVEVRGANAEVVWAGDAPVVTDFGSNTTTRRQGQD